MLCILTKFCKTKNFMNNTSYLILMHLTSYFPFTQKKIYLLCPKTTHISTNNKIFKIFKIFIQEIKKYSKFSVF